MNKIKTEVSIPTEFSYNKEGNKASIEVYPFEAGFGVSVAHPIRRTLIAATTGFAPVGLKIEGVKHEFDSLKGMLEDVASFIINLKNIRFKIKNSSKDEVVVEYFFTGPKEIKGADLINEEIDVVTPDEYIATLNEEGELKLTLLIKKGMGFVAVENFRDTLPEGFIGLDAYFSPIKKAVYNIENVLVEDDPNYEKVIFEVETDGQIDPIDAFKNAVNNYLNQFGVFSKEFKLETKKVENVELPDEYNILFKPIEELNLRSRSFNALDRAGIKFIGELVLMGKEKISNIKNLGTKSLEEIFEKLEEIGFSINKTLPLDFKKAIEEKLAKLKGEE
ncbi:DNA-directed RNA polymerase subunit alpha [Caminibacter mediatlanticus TB-2]|uniref:DNA-directed RNA polymerase subunit alpha n=1 Tax=Caminibacter mediatlanticus TB-2 TaxID=391592 RepID=A0AAI9AGR5_9BACT|nr:DNA-directed RNA polymerase subunit alpha [Caminibacter mediatlanticus]EDM23205.1 DNA-directed RNA polymerase subunit alpha [Caminibacter mediatlanticus TB-2]QCT93915.1 DNA-directed RNA polymerase subunit alpha [Caminibacter mediatlanticus TB-2]